MSNFADLCEELTAEIKHSYENSVTMQEAESLAGKFLYAQVQVNEALREADLDSRMKKAGLKAIRAAVYMEAATKTDKKPSDTLLDNLVNLDKLVQDEQDRFDAAEVHKNALENYYSIFREAHIHFRTIAKGAFNG